MKTQSDKERRREKHRQERQLNLRAMNMDPRYMVRCSGCGGLCKMPCLKCHLDALRTEQQKAKLTA